MKKIYRIVSLILCMVFILPTNIMAADLAQSGPYTYPVLPGSPEWKTFHSHKEMENACKIPEELLTRMSTKDLVETVVNYPILIDILAYESYQKAYDAILSYFNGLQELQNRPDAAAVLLDYYKKSPSVASIDSQNDLKESLKATFMEMILAQDNMFFQLNEDRETELFKAAEEKYLVRRESNKAAASPFFSVMASHSSNNYVKANVRDFTAYVYTPNNTAVSVTKGISDYSASEKQRIDQQVAEEYTHAIKRVSATPTYNCHAYAWHMQTFPSEKCWMSDPTAYMNDGSYTYSTIGATGYKVYYPMAEHSAVVWRVMNGPIYTVRSKWGELGLYEAEITYNPYTYTGQYYFYH